MKITYSAAMSQDEFIAKSDGDVSWLDGFQVDSKQSGLVDLFLRANGLVMGRKTYDFVESYGSWPYEDKPTWICTSRALTSLPGATIHVARSIDEVIQQAHEMQLTEIWLMGGGQLASDFLDRGLINNLSITELPIKLGTGIPLFSRHRIADIHFEAESISDYKTFRQLEFKLR